MTRLWVGFIFILVFCSIVFSQETTRGIGGGVGANLLIGDSPIVDSKISPNFGVFCLFGLTRHLDFKIQVGIGQLGVHCSKTIYTTTFVPVELNGLYSLMPDSKFNPFFQFGIGAMRFRLNNSPSYYDGMAIGGLGFKYTINPSWTWLMSANLKYTTGDDFNGHNDGMKDGYFNLQNGLTYNLSNDKQQYKKNDTFKEKEILAKYYIEEQKVLLKTQLENIRIEISKLEQELSYLNQMVGNHVTNVDQFSNKIYNFALNIGQEERVKVLAVKDNPDR